MHLISLFKKQILLFVFILTIIFTLQWYLLDYYFTGLPEYIPNTSIQIYGLVLLITALPVFYFYQKQIIAQYPQVKIWELVVLTFVLSLMAEIIFQFIRQAFEEGDLRKKIKAFLYSTNISVLLWFFISLLIAFHLKNKKSIWNKILPLIFVGLLFLAKYLGFIK